MSEHSSYECLAIPKRKMLVATSLAIQYYRIMRFEENNLNRAPMSDDLLRDSINSLILGNKPISD